ncbi:hypothetical protein [Mucilaginibacter jinjuensis]|uniref:SWIM-type domain-containing protein n=1 Tax=Mucilaginibacter jinjuensis TaxID=1176721 RepID=A0ABY7T3I9_9SPHI|nr:hypothetical protein [Mucilaginibacter jinjuensis]WCT11009.1 hypothetical protein PQO05_19925 [Mucilaginibacter jinjuensis]
MAAAGGPFGSHAARLAVFHYQTYNMMKKTIKAVSNARVAYDDLFFYAIPLENNDLLLDKAVLNKHYPAYKKLPKEKNGMHFIFTDYRDGIFTLVMQQNDIRFEQIYLGIEKKTLYVACDCGMPGAVLCEHAYKGLINISYGQNRKLEGYYWPGFEPDANGVSKYLDIDITRLEAYISPRTDFGNLYRRGMGFKDQSVVVFDHKLPESAKREEGAHQTLGYQLLYNRYSFYKNHLPFLLPFVGTTTKSGDDIGYYDYYLVKEKQFNHGLNLSNDQIILNEISKAMFEIATSVEHNKVKGEYSAETKEYIPLMLDLWRKAIPKLRFEQHLKSIYSHSSSCYRDRPRKADAKATRVTMDDLEISFILSDQGDYYQLKPVIKTNGKDISKDCYKVSLFVIEPITTTNFHFHLVGNLQDEYLLNWLSEDYNKLTVLKQDFESFHEGFLQQLTECYQISFRKYKGSMLQPFQYDHVKSQIQH